MQIIQVPEIQILSDQEHLTQSGSVVKNESKFLYCAAHTFLYRNSSFFCFVLWTGGLSYVFYRSPSTFRALPFKRPEKWISPHPNQYVQLQIKNSYIGNFMDKRFQGPFRDGCLIRPAPYKQQVHYLTIYEPESYIMHVSDFCRFLLCTVPVGGRGEAGEGGGLERGGQNLYRKSTVNC